MLLKEEKKGNNDKGKVKKSKVNMTSIWFPYKSVEFTSGYREFMH